MCNKENFKCGVSRWLVVLLIIAIGVGCITFGLHILISETNSASDATQETCFVLSESAVSCTYDDGTDTSYSYTAIAFDKCDNQTLYQERWEAKECPGDKKSVGEEYECHVYDCDKTEFVFDIETPIIGGVIWLVIGVIVLLSFAGCVYTGQFQK